MIKYEESPRSKGILSFRRSAAFIKRRGSPPGSLPCISSARHIGIAQPIIFLERLHVARQIAEEDLEHLGIYLEAAVNKREETTILRF